MLDLQVFKLIFDVGSLSYVMCKIFKVSNNMKFSLAMSIFFLLGYIQAFLGATEGVAKQRIFSNLEEYIIYTL